jgi:uncharacterized membrane protein
MYILVILVLGLFIRLVSLDQSLWLDEATTALVSKMSLANIFTKFLPGDFHPPLYYLVMKYWTILFGYSEISLRVPSIIFGLGTVYLIYLIGRKLFGEKAGLIAATFLATSGLSIYYSQEARMYMLAAFLVSVLIYLFIKRKWIGFSIILMLIGMTDYVSLFIIPVFFIAGWKYWKKISLSLLPLALSFVLWWSVFIKQIASGISVKGSNWWDILGLPTFKNLALIPVKFMLGRISFDDKTLYFLIVAVAACFFGYLLIKSLKASKVLWMWLILPIVLGTLISFKVPTLTYFRYLFCLTPFYLLLAYGVGKLGRFAKAVVILLIVFNLTASCYYLFNHKFQREDWRGMVSFVEAQKTDNSITIFPSSSNMEAYLYYAPGAKIAGPGGIKAGYDRIWLTDYLSSVFDPGGAAKSKVEALGYREKASYVFNGIGQVYLYEK